VFGVAEHFEKLSRWREFYIFVGGSAATLMGLMFVVMSLGQRALAGEDGARATRGFFTPIVVFFATNIVVTAIFLIPDIGATVLAALLACVAVVGVIYMAASNVLGLWRQSELGFDDLLWYVILPYIGYIAIGVAAGGIWLGAGFGFFTAGSAMLLLLLVGVRNAWDLVVYQIQRTES